MGPEPGCSDLSPGASSRDAGMKQQQWNGLIEFQHNSKERGKRLKVTGESIIISCSMENPEKRFRPNELIQSENNWEHELTQPLTEFELAEAKRLQEIAARAERKAAEKLKEKISQHKSNTVSSSTDTKFLSKQEREKLALERLEARRREQELKVKEAEEAHHRFITGKALEEKKRQERLQAENEERERERRRKEENKEAKEMDSELKMIREQYLGQAEKKRKIIKPSEKFAKIFQFDWEVDDDTARNDQNPLYNNRVKINSLFGRGYIAGTDQREQRKGSNFLLALSEKRMNELSYIEQSDSTMTVQERKERVRQRAIASETFKQQYLKSASVADSSSSFEKLGLHWSEKKLEDMTARDWRIFREDFDINIQGGRATLPLRFWSEANFPGSVMQGIEQAGYEKPSPIQRQAIPIGQAGRDIIGIAETGSGKTAAFLIPLLCYLLKVPKSHLDRCGDEGPLAIIMAPTRELAQQIEDECIKLARFTNLLTANVVGGQSIEEQGFKLRKGVHIVIGTPGRLCDCLQNNYLVLNQCNYVVLDEADRMVDMGFEPQVVEVLDSMGGLLKDEDEEAAEAQLSQVQQTQQLGQLFRVTAMFSATMPIEVERIAKTYLRHPVVIKIGDEDSGKNKRIEQRVQFITEPQKKGKLTDELRKLGSTEKAIVFVNAKKQGDTVGRYLDGLNIRSGVLHGGRSQDQREETLEQFRSGDIRVLVATDVAGRGLDIQDVSHVINFDCPSQITNYCHRIGRTGRAGKSGIAITFITESDTEIMHALKEYLESTNAAIPAQLAKHPAAQAPVGSRDDKGNIIGQKRESIKFAKK